MPLTFSTKKYIEENLALNEFACVYTHIPQSDEVSEVRGKMYTIVNMKGPEGLDAVTAVNAFLDQLENQYFSSDITGIPAVLERSIKAALFGLNTYLESVDILDGILFDFAAVVIKDDVLYIAKVEDAKIYLVRDNKALDISNGLFDPSNQKLVENGSGILEVGDTVILANRAAENLIADWSLLSRYSETELTRLIDPVKDGIEKVAFLV